MSDDRANRALDAIYAELNRQREDDELGGNGYWNPDWGRLDAEPRWGKVAEAVVAALDSTGGSAP